MTRDLDETLREMGPEYRALVARLMGEESVLSPLAVRRSVPWALVAASVAVVLAVGALFLVRPTETSAPPVYVVRATTCENEYYLAQVRDDAAVCEMIRTQRSDGGWKTDFLTRQNAAALRESKLPAARIAYKKAVRNLRLRGLSPL